MASKLRKKQVKPLRKRLLAPAEYTHIGPIIGLENAQDLTFREAIAYLQSQDPQFAEYTIDDNIEEAVMASKKLVADPDSSLPVQLTEDEIAVVHMYTQQTEFYVFLNRRARDEVRANFNPYLPVMKLLLSALYKLQPVQGTFYRGLQLNLRDKYRREAEYVWWANTSAVPSRKTLESDLFLGKKNPRTIFSIASSCAFNVTRYSALKLEEEYIFPPGSKFKIDNKSELGFDGCLIHLVQQEYAPLLSGTVLLSPVAVAVPVPEAKAPAKPKPHHGTAHPSSSTKKNQPCKYFAKGNCKRGDDCWYLHPIVPPSNGNNHAKSKIAVPHKSDGRSQKQ